MPATPMLDKATQSDPNLVDAWVGVAWLSAQSGDMAQALESIGFSPNELALVSSAQDDPTAAPSSSPGATKGGKARNLRHRLIKFGFGKNVLHAEGVVQTDEGTKTVVVQRGAVTAITSTSVTVKSSDGFTLTWSFGDPFTVVKGKARIEPSAVAVGTQVGIAGAKEGTATNARLMVVARTK